MWEKILKETRMFKLKFEFYTGKLCAFRVSEWSNHLALLIILKVIRN